MSVIAEFWIPADEFAFGHLLEVREGVQVRLESMVPTGEHMIPHFWVEAPDIDDVEEALLGSPIVDSVSIVDRLGDEALFQVTWSEDVNGVVETIRETESVILSGTGHGDHWSFQLRFPSSTELSQFYQQTLDKGIEVELRSVHNPIDGAGSMGAVLTEAQLEALSVAYEEGYFSVPRQITLVELAERLGISDSAASQRIRRGLSKLLGNGLSRQ